MSEIENNVGARLCGKQRECVHVIRWRSNFALIALLYIWLFSGETEVKFWYMQGYITLAKT